MKKQRIIRRSAKEGRPGRTDWDRLDRLSDADIERAVASDADASPLLDAAWFRNARLRPRKEMISIRLDADVLAFFREEQAPYQSRINEVLRAYMDAVRKERG